eukprot:351071-Chlamydomonas_euryale.AAC.2
MAHGPRHAPRTAISPRLRLATAAVPMPGLSRGLPAHGSPKAKPFFHLRVVEHLVVPAECPTAPLQRSPRRLGRYVEARSCVFSVSRGTAGMAALATVADVALTEWPFRQRICALVTPLSVRSFVPAAPSPRGLAVRTGCFRQRLCEPGRCEAECGRAVAASAASHAFSARVARKEADQQAVGGGAGAAGARARAGGAEYYVDLDTPPASIISSSSSRGDSSSSSSSSSNNSRAAAAAAAARDAVRERA